MNLKEKISERIQLSTAYGLPNILRSKPLFNKMFWLFFLIISFSLASFYIVTDLIDYFDYKVVTVVKTEYDLPVEFPTVSFCNSLSDISFDIPESSATFMNKNLDRDKDFESFISPIFSKCFRFNSGKNMTNHSIPIRKLNFNGQFYAFELILRENITIMIHNKSSSPNLEAYYRSDLIYALPNKLTKIGVDRIIESKLGEPHNQCLKDVSKFKGNKTIIDYFQRKKQAYSRENCQELCFDLFFLKDDPCNCQNPEIGSVWELCHARSKNPTCTEDYRDQFENNNNLVEKCSDYCPLECDTITFSYSLTTDQFPALNSSLIRIYYNSLRYTSITQLAKIEPEQLVSNLGGYLGLFVGISFVSLFEIAELIIEIIFMFRGKRNKIEPEIKIDIQRILKLESEMEEYKLKINQLVNLIEVISVQQLNVNVNYKFYIF